MRARLALAASGQQVELREVLLRHKPVELLDASPKGTVPVLVNGDTVIDESLDIMYWALERNDPRGWLKQVDTALIDACDGPFKSALDRYKYSSRFPDTDGLAARDAAFAFIAKLEEILAGQPHLSGEKPGLADRAIVTFVRQYANVDIDWFNIKPVPNVIKWLADFTHGGEFAAIMQKYPKWQAGDPVTLFPEAP